MTTPTVFISYSHKDEPWKDRLVAHLGGLQQQGLLDAWDDRRIEAGDDWRAEIEAAIQAASIAVLLISANFLSSTFITRVEIPRLLQRRQRDGIRIIPIILSPCDWQGIDWLETLQARPKDGRPLSAGTDHQIEADLAAIAREIRELLKRAGLPRERPQYVPLPPDQISLAKLPTTQHALFGRDKELKLLDEAWANPHCHVVCLVAFGGVGKTALVNEWLNRVGADNYRGAERVYGWSFYSQGTREDKQASADSFFDDALKFFGYTGELLKSPWDKGVLLAKLIQERKTLLILDGLEPMQYPPGIEEGRLRDPGLQALLKDLARFNNGLAVLTTRCPVADIGHTIFKSSQQIDLENLSPEAGMELLRETGVFKGTNQELQQAVAEYEGHALALTLLGRYLAIRFGGDIRTRDRIKKIIYDKEKKGLHARHVMDWYIVWLNGKPELEILYIMGLFDRPAPLGAIDVLRKDPVIKGLTDNLCQLSSEDWDFTIQHLQELRLLYKKDNQSFELLDCHPLIREHFGHVLKNKNFKAWKRAQIRLYEYFKNIPEKIYNKYLPDTQEEMEPLFQSVIHGCLAERYQEVFNEIYQKRIQRKNEYFSTDKLGLIGADLACLACFFDIPWSNIINTINKETKSLILNLVGIRLRASGRLIEAINPSQLSLKEAVNFKDWRNASPRASVLSEIYRTIGNLDWALIYAQKSVKFAEKSGDSYERIIRRTTLAHALHQIGHIKEAEQIFYEAEQMQSSLHPKYPYPILYAHMNYRYCELLLDKGQYKDVQDRSIQTLEWAKSYKAPLWEIALHHLSIGKAQMKIMEQEKIDIFSKAKIHLDNAVDAHRRSGNYNELPRSLLARADLFRIIGEWNKSFEDIEEAFSISMIGSMKFHQVDYHLEATRLLIAEFGMRNAAAPMPSSDMLARLQNHVEQAVALVQQTGYHRRDPELALGYAGLSLLRGELDKAQQPLAEGRKMLEKMGVRCWDFWVNELEEQISGKL